MSKPKCTYAVARQEQVLELVSQGRSRAEIAAQLYMSVHTVHSLLNRLYDRLGASTPAHAVRRGFESGALIPNTSQALGLVAENQALRAELGRVYRALVEANRQLRNNVHDSYEPHQFSEYLHGLRHVS